MNASSSARDPRAVGFLKDAPLDLLRLDGRNPRFKVDVDPEDQTGIATELADRYDALAVASSIARSGFHVAEPPAVIAHDDGTYVVVEGNRRVAALKGLVDEKLRANFADAAQWNRVAATAAAHGRLPAAIPVVQYNDREAAAPLIANRHLIGAKKWEPQQQDRYVHDLVDRGKSFSEVADLMGIKVGDAKRAYRNYHLLAVDAPRLGVAVAADLSKYTVLGNVLENRALRQHAQVVDVSDVRPGESSVSDALPSAEVKKALGEMFTWVLGSASTPAVLDDSRRVVKLAQAVSAATGLAALRAGKSLDEALQAMEDEGTDPFASARRSMTVAGNSLRVVAEQLALLEPEQLAVIASMLPQVQAHLANVVEACPEPADAEE